MPVAVDQGQLDRTLRRRLLGGKIGVCEDVGGSRTAGGVIREHHLKEFEGLRRDQLAVLVHEDGRLAHGRTQEWVPLQFGDSRPFTAGRCAKNRVDLVELVDLTAVAREDGRAGEELNQDTSCTPDIDGRSILCLTKEELRTAVPYGNNSVRVVLRLTPFEEPSETKVGKLEVAALGDQDIGGFDIAVQDAATVKMLETFEELLGKMLLVCRRQRKLGVVDQPSKIMLQVFKDHEAVVFLDHDLT